MTRMYIFWGLLAFLLAGCSAAVAGEPSPESQDPPPGPETMPGGEAAAAPEQSALPAPTLQVELEDFGPAPELTNEVWLNTGQPLRLADLRGQVVLLDMWTFG